MLFCFPKGLYSLTFWPLSRKLKGKFLCDLCVSSEAGGESMSNYLRSAVSQPRRNRLDCFDYLVGIVDILMFDTLGDKDNLLRPYFQCFF